PETPSSNDRPAIAGPCQHNYNPRAKRLTQGQKNNKTLKYMSLSDRADAKAAKTDSRHTTIPLAKLAINGQPIQKKAPKNRLTY
ncbi:hypothetical protein, partial [Roseibium sediminis]|uniref:hypothetical protein n=1 Tax=Roseibium sediminis TaxID=1775174 RepID=UPI00195E9F7D